MTNPSDVSEIDPNQCDADLFKALNGDEEYMALIAEKVLAFETDPKLTALGAELAEVNDWVQSPQMVIELNRIFDTLNGLALKLPEEERADFNPRGPIPDALLDGDAEAMAAVAKLQYTIKTLQYAQSKLLNEYRQEYGELEQQLGERYMQMLPNVPSCNTTEPPSYER